jgi:2-hydroxychromene-2-carboxylate isomerase
MALTIDYFLVPQSPWTYFGHARFMAMAAAAGATVRIKPMDLGQIFPKTGGLPVGQRSAQRQAYRLTELERFSKWLGAPLHLKPTYFPVNGDDAAKLIIAVDMAVGAEAAMNISGAILSAVWSEQRNIADEKTLAELLQEQSLPVACLEQSYSQAAHERYESYTQMAIDAGVFGAPSYLLDGEIFWGQDRLDFVERALAL